MTPPPSLDELIRTVQNDSPSADPLDQLATASATAAQLGETSDAMLGYYVDRCRGSGRTWTEISSVLGVSKQAVHKRFSVAASLPNYERFTERTRAVLAQSRTEASELGHAYVGTEHLLLAFFVEPKAIATAVLAKHGLTRDAVLAAVLERVPRRTADVTETPNTPRLSKMLQEAVVEAVDLGHNYVGTEHLLLAFYRQPESLGTQVLAALGAPADAIRDDVLKVLATFQKKA